MNNALFNNFQLSWLILLHCQLLLALAPFSAPTGCSQLKWKFSACLCFAFSFADRIYFITYFCCFLFIYFFFHIFITTILYVTWASCDSARLQAIKFAFACELSTGLILTQAVYLNFSISQENNKKNMRKKKDQKQKDDAKEYSMDNGNDKN